MSYKKINAALTCLLLLIATSANAGVITYDSLSILNNNTSNLVVEDWQSYSNNTILSNNSINGIAYPDDNTLGEPLVTGCQYLDLWCINYHTESEDSRSFGSSAVTFGFTQAINAFSLYLVQGTNGRGPGVSEWDIEFDSGEIFSMRSVYSESDSLGFSYFAVTGINSTGFTIRQTRNDANVVWSFNHIGYQAAQVTEPSTLAIFMLGLMSLTMRRFSK
jgi:hypothetical protein